MDWMPQAIRDATLVVLIISGPMIIAAAGIGLVVGILQAATQIQEQTIGSSLKIIGIFLLIIMLGYWMFGYLNNYTQKTISSAFTFVPAQTEKVVTPGKLKRGKTIEPNPLPELPVIEGEQVEENVYDTLPPGTMYLGQPDQKSIPLREVRNESENFRINEEDIEEKLPEGYEEPIPLME